jgi:hypothetical protein
MKLLGTDTYTKVILTAIAGLLACDLLARQAPVPVHAEGPWRHTVVHLVAPFSNKDIPKFEKALNDASNGGELVSVIPVFRGDEYMVVFKQR